MDEAEARRRVAAARVGRLATARPDGSPHAVPFVFVLDGDVVYWTVDRKPKRSAPLARLVNIRANPSVEFVVDHYEEDWRRAWWVRGRGVARILDRGDESERAAALLAKKYPQYRVNPPQGPVVAIDVVRWTAWEAAASPRA